MGTVLEPTDRRPATPTGRDLVGWAAAALQAFCLELLWLLGCLPVVTAPASTTAMISALRRWRVDGEAPTARRFAIDLRRSFGAAALTGLLGLAVAAFLAVDVLAIGQMGAQRRVLLVAWLALALGLALVAVFVPVVLAERVQADRGGLRSVLIESARRAVAHPVRAAIAAGALVGAAALVSVSPISLLVVGVLAGVMIERLGDVQDRRVS